LTITVAAAKQRLGKTVSREEFECEILEFAIQSTEDRYVEIHRTQRIVHRFDDHGRVAERPDLDSRKEFECEILEIAIRSRED
jgi:hypothetical protein